MTVSRGQNYIAEARESSKKVFDGINELVALQREWNAMDYGSTLANGVTGGSNEGILAADVGAVVFATANALAAVLNAGHATNMVKIL